MNLSYVSPRSLPTSSFVLSLFLFLLCLQSVVAFVEVTASNSSITYFGDWVVQNGGLYRYTAQAGAYASLTFQGTSISWFGDKDPNGGLASVQVDNDSPTTVDVSAGMAKGEDTQVAALFTKSGLDGNSQHTITVSWAGDSQGIYITLFYFQYDPPTLIVNPSPTAASPATTKVTSSTPPAGQSTVTVINGQTTIVVTPTNTQGQVSTPSTSPPQTSGETSSIPNSSDHDTSRSSSSLNSAQSLAELSAGSLTTSFSAITSTLSGSVVITSVPVVVPVPSSSPENTVSGTTPTTRISAGAVAGGVIGGLALLILIAVLLFRVRRRALNRQSGKMEYMQATPYPVSSGNLEARHSAASRNRRMTEEMDLPSGPRLNEKSRARITSGTTLVAGQPVSGSSDNLRKGDRIRTERVSSPQASTASSRALDPLISPETMSSEHSDSSPSSIPDRDSYIMPPPGYCP